MPSKPAMQPGMTRKESNIKKAFVVAYCEGKKISTQEAIQLVDKMKTAGN